MMRVGNKVAVVTGGAGGIGGETARTLAREGARVVITDLEQRGARDLADEIGGHFLCHDVCNEEQWRAVARDVMGRYGRIDVLVNSAGIEGDLVNAGGLATTYVEWRRVMAVNLDGTFLGCMAVLPGMLERGVGSIINIASAASFMATPTALAYGASKAAVQQLTQSLALIGAKGGARVRCNSVHPGSIKTRMTDYWVSELARQWDTSEAEAEATMLRDVPFGTRGKPADVANMVLFLASDEAAYVTGAAFKVDAGYTMASTG
jgi:NAD(P)-dependent dehydrogenase (short-subunit alcohol dehydrogenase family)